MCRNSNRHFSCVRDVGYPERKLVRPKDLIRPKPFSVFPFRFLSLFLSFILAAIFFFISFFFLPQEEREKNEKKTKKQEQKTIRLTVSLPPLNCSLIFSRISTTRLISRWSRRPKSLNMVEPPERTIFLYRGRLTSIGQFWITVSTISDIGVVKSGLANCNNATAKMKQ